MYQLREVRNLSVACDLLASDNFRIVAGATDLYASADHIEIGNLLDISRIEALRRIEVKEQEVRIGAAVTWSEIRQSILPGFMAALKQAAATIGGIQIQNRGTVGGNICNASPAADGVLSLMALDAEVEIISTNERRRLPLTKLFKPSGGVDLKRYELLEAIVIPIRRRSTSSFVKLGRRRDLAISVLATAVTVDWRPDGKIASARAFVGAASKSPTRLRTLEHRMVGMSPLDHPGSLANLDDVAGLSPIDDMRGSTSYRRQIAPILLDRALRQASKEPHSAQ